MPIVLNARCDIFHLQHGEENARFATVEGGRRNCQHYKLGESGIQKLATALCATGGFKTLTATLHHPNAEKLFQLKG